MDAERARIAAALDRWREAGAHRSGAAWGQAAVEPGATVTGSTRVVLALGGRNRMRLPCGDSVIEEVLGGGEAVVVDRRSWNRPLHSHPMSFLTIDLQSDHVRLYLRDQPQAGPQPAQVTGLLLHGAADPALRAAADAAESLVAVGGGLLAQAVALVAGCAQRLLGRPLQVADPTWQRLREWIDEHLHEAIGRDEAAAACGVHPGHVSRVVARAAGVGFAAWIAQRRVRRARDLLSGGDLPVAEIGRRCGFSSAAYFNHVFRAEIGLSPGAWRRTDAAARLTRP